MDVPEVISDRGFHENITYNNYLLAGAGYATLEVSKMVSCALELDGTWRYEAGSRIRRREWMISSPKREMMRLPFWCVGP